MVVACGATPRLLPERIVPLVGRDEPARDIGVPALEAGGAVAVATAAGCMVAVAEPWRLTSCDILARFRTPPRGIPKPAEPFWITSFREVDPVGTPTAPRFTATVVCPPVVGGGTGTP